MEPALVNFSRKCPKRTMKHGQKRIIFCYFKSLPGKKKRMLQWNYFLLEVLCTNRKENALCFIFVADLLSYEV